MRAAIVSVGIVVLILGVILSIFLYPGIGYASVEETANEMDGFDMEVISGEDLKFIGTVENIYNDDVPGVDILFDLAGIMLITIEGLEVGDWLFGDQSPVYIICDNSDISEGDDVAIEGTGYNYGGLSFIFGEDAVSAISKMATYRTPEAASVKPVSYAGMYLGIMIIIVGLIIAIIGAAIKKKHAQQNTQPPPPQSPHMPAQCAPYPPPPPPIQQQSAPPPPPPVAPAPPPPPPPPPQQSYPCNYCRQPMRYIDQYQKWYCDYCRRYA